MNTNKIALLAIAVVAIGIFALPSTVSLFSGQHSWYGLDDSGSQVPCMKCHGDIDDEMTDDLNGVHTTLASPGCDCHRVSGTGVADGDGTGDSEPGTTSHAAETIACMICHEYDTRTGENYPFAGGFNTTKAYAGTGVPGTDQYNYSWDDGVNDSLSGIRAAHNDFITESIKSDLMTDSNEACIACHTRIGVNITWRKSTTMHFNANESNEGVWELTDFTAHGQDFYESTYQNNWTNSY